MENFGDVFFKWQINDKETCALIVYGMTAHPAKVYFIKSKEQVELLTRLISHKTFLGWQVRIYDEDGHETQRINPEWNFKTFDDFEVKLGVKSAYEDDWEEVKKLVKQFNETEKHQKRLARRREAYRRKMWRKRNPNKIKFFKNTEEES